MKEVYHKVFDYLCTVLKHVFTTDYYSIFYR